MGTTLASRVALVTGGMRGIGLGISKSLAREGWNLAVCGVRSTQDVKPAYDEIMREAENAGFSDMKLCYYICDISDTSSRESMIKKIGDDFGQLNLLVNNAGVGARERCDLLDMKEENYEWLMRTNLQGPFFLTQAVAKWFIQQKQQNDGFSGAVVTITSISATVASVSRGEYCISKSGLSMASSLWAVRLAEFGFPCYEIRPGLIRTDMTETVVKKYDKLIAEGILLNPRWGYPEDIGRAVATLARGDLAYSTGQVLMLDGGMLVQRL